MTRAYRDGTMVLETAYQTEEGSVTVIDLMPLRSAVARPAPDGRRHAGAVRMRMELVMRFDYGSIVPWVQRTEDGMQAIAGPTGCA